MDTKDRLLEILSSRVFKNISALMILQGANYLLPLFVMPYMIRVLGIGNYGIYAFAQAIALYLIVFTDYGFSISGAKMVSVKRDDKRELSRIFHSIMGLKFFLLLLVLASYVLLIFSWSRLKNDSLIYLYSTGIIFGQTFIPIWFFQGMERMKYITIINVLIKVLFAVLLVVLVKSPKDLELAMICQSLSFVTAFIFAISIIYLEFKLKTYFPTKDDLYKLLGEGKHMFFSTLSISMYRNTNIIILGLYAGDVVIGIYSSAEKVVKAIQNMISPISQAIFPMFSFKFKEMPVRMAIQEIGVLTKYYVIGLLFLSSVVVFVEPFIENLLKIDNDSFKYTYYLLTPLIVFGSLNYLLGIVGLVNLNLEKYFSKITLTGGVVNIIFCVLLAPILLAEGVALSLFISEFVITLLISLVIWKVYNGKI